MQGRSASEMAKLAHATGGNILLTPPPINEPHVGERSGSDAPASVTQKTASDTQKTADAAPAAGADEPCAAMQQVVELDSLTVYDVVDNETDGLSAPCVCCANPSSGITYSSEFPRIVGRKKALDFDAVTSAAHGLSLLLVGEKDGQTRCCLLDAGPNAPTFATNATKMELDLSAVEHFVLSHYHIDHSGGMRTAVPMVSEARKAAGLPPLVVDLHPDCPEAVGFSTPDGSVRRMAPENPSFAEVEAMGGSVIASKEPRAVCDGYFFVSGEIPRHTDYETGIPNQVRRLPGEPPGEWTKDPLVANERYVAAKVKGAGMVVFSSCSHAGIVNVCRDAQAKSGGASLFGIMGGLHLAGRKDGDADVASTVADLAALNPSVIFAGHCTGWRAKMALAAALPGRLQPAVVGGTYRFAAPPCQPATECPDAPLGLAKTTASGVMSFINSTFKTKVEYEAWLSTQGSAA